MDRFIAAFAALLLVFFMATLALFLILVETADAAVVDTTFTGPSKVGLGEEITFTLAYTPSVSLGTYTGTSAKLQVNGSLLTSANYSLDPAKGLLTFFQTFLDPGQRNLDVILDVIYFREGALSGGTYACASGISCTLFYAPHIAGTKVLVAEDIATANLSIFVGPTSDQPALREPVSLQAISPVPLGGSLPLLLSAIALFGVIARCRRVQI